MLNDEQERSEEMKSNRSKRNAFDTSLTRKRRDAPTQVMSDWRHGRENRVAAVNVKRPVNARFEVARPVCPKRYATSGRLHAAVAPYLESECSSPQAFIKQISKLLFVTGAMKSGGMNRRSYPLVL